MIFTDGIHVISSNSLEELHHFCVGLVGMKREWFQDHPRHPHYDTTAKSTQRKALKCGARLVRKEEISIRIKIFVRRPPDCMNIVDCICSDCGPYPHYVLADDIHRCANCSKEEQGAKFGDYCYVRP